MSKKNHTLGSLSRKRHTSAASASPAMFEALEPRLLLSLVAHLELNETSGSTAADTVSDHDGTLRGNTTWDDARIDNGAYFDGSNDYIEVDNSEDFNFGATDSFTISTWVRNDGSASFAAALIRGNTSAMGLGYGGYSAGPGFFMGQFSGYSDSYMFSLSDGTTGVYAKFALSNADGYHLLTMVVDRSTDEMRCYADGTLLATKSISSVGSFDGGSDVLQIGGSAYWTGMIDDVRVYDHALSTSDVEDLYEDAPTWVSIYSDDPIATEDDSGDDTGTFRVLRTGSLDGAITVNYSVSGTATGADYSETLSGTVTIGDGESEATITITPVDDAADDAQTVTLTLAAGTGYTVTDIDEATAVIYDDAGLLAHWELDETSGTTASDSAGHYSATLAGDATWTAGWLDNGAAFDGVGDYLAVDSADLIDFGASQNFTIAVWLRDDSTGNYHTVIAKGNEDLFYGTNDEGAGWSMGQCVYLKTYGFAISDGVNKVSYVSNNAANGDGEFHQMAMVVDRDTQYLYCYLDGQFLAQRDISSVGSLTSYGEALNIGGDENGWLGVLDDVRIYTHAMDGTAIQDLYESTMPPVFIEAIDDTAYESSGNTATFRVYRNVTFGDWEVGYSVSGTATSADYSETLSGTVTIANGTSYTDITITPVSDAADDGETLILTITSGTDYAVGDPNEATATIYENDPLIMRLELDETFGTTANDSMSNHDGTLYGDTTWDDGRIENGAYFDGSGDYIDVDNSTDFNFGMADSFTVSAWIRDDGSDSWAAAVNRGHTSAVGMGWGWYTEGPGFYIGKFSDIENSFIFTLSDGTAGTCAIYSPAYADGYHLLTMVVDRSTDEMYCYADGALFATQDISSVGSLDGGSDVLQIAGGGRWKGMIDDVRVYTCALDADDVVDLYADAPTWVSIYADDPIATEDSSGADTGTFRVLRTGDLDGDITVNYSVSGTATSADYSETLSGTVTIAAGESEAIITITPVDDAADDAQTVTLTLAASTGYAVSDINEATVVIYDDAGLLAHWELDETSGTTASDSTGHYSATLEGDATWTAGMIDNGVYMDGTGDYISVDDADTIDFDAEQSFTVTAWVRDDSTGLYHTVIAKGNEDIFYNYNYEGAGWGMGQCVYQKTYGYGISDGTDKVVYVSNNQASADGQFHLMSMVVDRDTDTLYCYLDNELLATRDISSVGSLASFHEALNIGGDDNGWLGMIDDVRIYTYALDSTAIYDLSKDPFAPVYIASFDSTAYENSADTAVFRVYRNNTDGDLEISYTVSGTATSADYSETLSGTVTIADGTNYTDITITPVSDAADDGETLTVTLIDGYGYNFDGSVEATAMIYDDDHLLAHLELDETSGTTADDAVGNHDGTLFGSTTWDDGRIDNGASFDAGSDSIDLSNSDDFDFGASTSFTVSVWVQGSSEGHYSFAVSRGSQRAGWSTADGAGWGIGQYQTSTGRYYFGITDGSHQASYTVSDVYDTDQFHLLAMVVDRSAATMYCYVDGELAGSKSISTIGSISSPGEALKIAESYNENWEGVIDDLRIYDTALSASDVTALYNNAPTWALVQAVDDTALEDAADTATFRIYRTGPTYLPMVVNYTVSGTASSADYSETLGGTATIAAGESYVDITITPVDDATSDSGETVTLTLTSGSGYTVGNLDSGTATIDDTGQLLMHLKLDETSGSTAADDTGNGHTGTRYGDTTWDEARDDNGAYFDGSGDYMEVANSSDFDFGASQSFTLSTWVRDDGDASFAAALIRGGTSAIGLGYGASTQGPGFVIGKFSTYDGTFLLGLSDGSHAAYATCNPGYADGYHLLTMVVDRSAQEMYCYADGELFGTANISSVGNLDGGSDILRLAGSSNWEGMVDDVRVYNYALADTDVQALYEDVPTWVSMYADDSIASEEAVGTDDGTFRVLRTGSLDSTTTVNYSVSGTASGGDYSETLSGTITFAIGQSEAEITITPVADGSADDGETVTVTLAAGTGYEISEFNDGTITIYDEAGLLAHWELDETSGTTASDSTGNGFTGTLVGDTTWDYGRVDGGAYFDGSGDYITVANSESLDFGGDQSFTVSAWMRDDGTTSHPAAIAKGNLQAHYGYTYQGAGWAMGRYGSGGFAFGVTDGVTAESFYDAAGTGYDLLTMVVDRGADTMRGYVNGELVAQVDISEIGSLASLAETLYIGRGNATAKGIIDDVRVYTYALTSADIAALYADTPPKVSIEAFDDVASETGSEPATFRISRDGDMGEALEVSYSVSGTAAGADYSETLSGTATIAAGDSYVDITITPVDDASNEGDETVVMTLTPSTDYALESMAAAAQTITIGDSDNVSDPQVVYRHGRQ